MSKVKLNLRGLSPLEKIAKAKQIVEALTSNSTFPSPQPSLSVITANITASETAFNDAQSARQVSIAKTNLSRETDFKLEASLRQLAAHVESIAGADEDKILSAGMSLRSAAAPKSAATAPTGLGATEGDHEGEIDLSWDKVGIAKSYEIQRSADPPTQTSWMHEGISVKSSFTVSGLASGTRYWFRVRAVSSAGASGWSDPATKIAP